MSPPDRVQQVLLTTACSDSKLYVLDKHFIMKITAILSTPSWQTTSKCSRPRRGHSSLTLLPSARAFWSSADAPGPVKVNVPLMPAHVNSPVP